MSLRSEGGKFDLNRGDLALFVSLLRVVGIARETAQRIARDLAEKRKSDTEGAGIATLAALRALVGGNDLADCLSPDVTVFTHSPTVDYGAASDRMRAADDAVNPHAKLPSLGILAATVAGGVAVPAGTNFELNATGTVGASGRHLARRTILRVTGNPRDPIWILEQSPGPRSEDVQAACTRLQRLDAP
jgi:hypothetical protein